MNEQAITDAMAHSRRCRLLEGARLLDRAGIESARLDAEVLLCHALAVSRTELYLNFEQKLSPGADRLFQSCLERRARHEPVAYITGVKEFWSLEFGVDRNVLIPRPETELLVEWTLSRARKIRGGRSLKIIDLGTGSGAIAIALATELPDARFWAVDVSPAALTIARRNARRHGVEQRLQFVNGDLFEPLLGLDGRFDLIVANPPYVATPALGGLPPEVRAYEPVQALDGGPGGIEFYCRIIAGAPQFLVEGGSLLCEIGADQGQAVRGLFGGLESFETPVIYQDLAGRERVVAAMKGGAGG